jgi:uncharacterized YccA/Bax inhibitor family protein
MTAYWFKPRRFGYGATPVTWEGWAITLATLVLVLASLLVTVFVDESAWVLAAVLIDVGAIGALLVVSYRKTDGKWRWRWGNG